MVEGQAADKWLKAKLVAAAGVTALVSTRIYPGFGPTGATYPQIVYSYLSGVDRPTVGGTSRILSVLRYTIKAVVEGSSFASADAIDLQIDTALAGVPSSVVVGATTYQVGAVREQTVRFSEVDAGSQYRHVGGIYRLVVSL